MAGGGRPAIRRDHGLTPPSRPRPDDSLQAHLHILVPRDGVDEAEREAVGRGARPVDTKDGGGPRAGAYGVRASVVRVAES